MSNATPLPSDTPEFHEERASGIGGSDAASVCAVNPWRSPLELFFEKRGELKPSPMDERTRTRLRFGLLVEDMLSSEYTLRTERKTRRQRKAARHPEHPELLCHLDRRVYPVETEERKTPGVLEIKSPGEFTRKDWDGGEVPVHYAIQMQHSLNVTGLEWGAFAVLLGKDEFLTIDVERDQEFVGRLQDAELEFWQRVLNNDPPDPTSHDNEVLGKLYATADQAGVVDLPARFLDMDRERVAVMLKLKELKEQKDAIDAAIKFELKTNVIGRLPDGSGSYKWGVRNRKEYTVKAAQFRQLSRLKK